MISPGLLDFFCGFLLAFRSPFLWVVEMERVELKWANITSFCTLALAFCPGVILICAGAYSRWNRKCWKVHPLPSRHIARVKMRPVNWAVCSNLLVISTCLMFLFWKQTCVWTMGPSKKTIVNLWFSCREQNSTPVRAALWQVTSKKFWFVLFPKLTDWYAANFCHTTPRIMLL